MVMLLLEIPETKRWFYVDPKRNKKIIVNESKARNPNSMLLET